MNDIFILTTCITGVGMIYFDNGATTLQKPPAVAYAVFYAVNNFANHGRSFYEQALQASREIYKTRQEIARLTGLEEPLNVAFTSSSTESLNLVIYGLISGNDSVITTVMEHNSVLRPLYNTGCGVHILDCDDECNIDLENIKNIIDSKTKYFICTHGSNVTGSITDIEKVRQICYEYGLTLILDVSQTMGMIETTADMADILCFTGHKSLFGPQGTGGIIIKDGIDRYGFKLVKTGGSGVNSFDRFQPSRMPDFFEAGTLNSHCIYGLQKGVGFINEIGIEAINKKDTQLANYFYDGVCLMKGFTVYGRKPETQKAYLPVVSINFEHMDAAELSFTLWDKYRIATRAGSHCAPLVHKRFGTESRGMVRFSFSYFNTMDEIEYALKALCEISGQ